MFKRLMRVLAVTILLMTAAQAPNALAAAKNVIIMVPDGCSQSVVTAARYYKGSDLAVDSMLTGMMKTDMVNSVITGSAAAATAFASGYKTTARFIGLGPRPDDAFATVADSLQYRPLTSTIEAAKVIGKATGLVSTSRITHATPASFSAHIMDRGWDNEIMEHLVYSDLNVVFGGGKRHLLTTADGGKRTDGEDLYTELINMGYAFVETKTEMDALPAATSKVWGMFAGSHMKPDLDRQYYKSEEPSLAEMTAKAIDIMSQDADGFVLVVEGSQVDWAGHANDPIYMITDFLAFDDAVKVAKDFAETDGNTLVLVFPDHNTGGLAIGNANTNSGSDYTSVSKSDLIGPLQNMVITSSALAGEITDMTDAAAIKTGIKTFWGIDATDADTTEIIELVNAGSYDNTAISYVISKNHTLFGWTTYGHNGEDVPLWSYGPDRPVGLYDNTDLADISVGCFINAADDRDWLNTNLYMDVRDIFPSTYSIDKTDAENPVLKIGSDATLPTSKNLLHLNGKTYRLHGLVVYSPRQTWCQDTGDESVSSAKDYGTDCDTDEIALNKDWESVFIPIDAKMCIEGDCSLVTEVQ